MPPSAWGDENKFFLVTFARAKYSDFCSLIDIANATESTIRNGYPRRFGDSHLTKELQTSTFGLSI